MAMELCLFMSKVFPHLNPKSFFRFLLTSKQHWCLPKSDVHGAVIEAYFRHHFFDFAHGNFDWKHQKFDDAVCIRAAERQKCEGNSHVGGYEFTVDPPTAELETAVVGSIVRRGCLLWRDMYSEVRQRALMLRHLCKGHDSYFDVGDERWVRIEDMALTEAVCQTAAAWSTHYSFGVESYKEQRGFPTRRTITKTNPKAPRVDQLRSLVDVAIYRRTDKATGAALNDQHPCGHRGPIGGTVAKDELCKLWYMGAADDLQFAVQHAPQLIKTGTHSGGWHYKPLRRTEVTCAFRKLDFAETFTDAVNFPLLGACALHRGARSTQGADLLAAEIVQNSTSIAETLPLDCMRDLHDDALVYTLEIVHKQPVNSTTGVVGINTKDVPSFRSTLLHRFETSVQIPRIPYESVIPLAIEKLLHKINKIRLAVLGIEKFYPYADGTLWEMSDCHTLPVFSDQDKRGLISDGQEEDGKGGDGQARPYYGNCNNVYIGPEAVLVVRFSSEILDAAKASDEARQGFNMIAGDKMFC